ncbi:MAG: LamG domain-containing protein, partial [Schleiferiaceae bacterium]|nr:LamG domain-containing protein [Schleiferiaceae bacterium]
MKKSLLFCLFFLLLGTYASAQLPGSGNTASFDNSFLSPLQLFPPVPAGTTLPVTVAAWVNLQLITGKDFYPIFSSNNNFQGTTGFFLRIRRPGFAIILEAGFGDGTNTAFRSGPLPLPVVNSGSGWFHLAAVIVDINTIVLYVNGNEMTNSFPNGNAVNMSNTGALGGFIGGQYFNGARVPFSGQIDHLNVWNTALSVTEIRQHMCSKINPATANLLYYFDFDIQPAGVLGFSSFSGAGPTIASGGAAQILSGAPIGDTSVFVYRPNNNWIGQSVALVTGTSSMQAVFNANVPEGGFHIYKVNQSPNNTNGISSNCLSNEYWGTFYAFQSSNIPPLSHVIQYRSPSAPTQAWQRLANNTPTWANQVPINIVAGGVNIPIINPRREWIFPLSSPTYNPNLAPVYNTCAFPLAISVPRPSSAVLSWSNGGGDTVQNFLGPGTYSLTVTDTLCNSTQVFSFIINSQGAFVYNPNLPDTIRRCVYPFSLSVPSFNGGTLLWSDSTTTTSIAITNPGNYSLSVNDTCAGDSVFTFVVAPANPQPITFNPNLPDTLFRCNFPFSVNVPAWPDGIFLWSDSTTGTSFVVPSHGNFSLTVTDSCGNDSVFNFVVAPSSFPPYDPLLPDTLFRCVTPFNLSVPSFQGGTLLWPDSTFGTNFFLVPELGSYELQAIDSCGNSLSYPFVVSASTSPPIPVNTPDTLFTCPGDSVIFVYTPPAGVTAVDWSNGQTGNTFSTSIPGSYTLQITDTCGAVFSKTIVVDTLSF